MSKGKILESIMSTFFPKSEKAISEKLSTEEHNEFSEDVNELNERINAQKTANEALQTDLDVANVSVTELTAKLETANESLATAKTQLAEVTKERNTYKEHYDKSAGKGDGDGNEDENSRNSTLASYNQNGLDEWARTHAK